MNPSIAGVFMILMLDFITGCEPREEAAEPTPKHTPPPIAAEHPPLNVAETEFDFGTVLSRGQTLRHAFEVVNTTDQAVTLREAVPNAPCCSAITLPTRTVNPRDSTGIPVEFRPGTRTGPNRILFQVHVGDEKRWTLGLAIRANVLQETEVEQVEPSDTTTTIGNSALQRYRIISRALEPEGLGAPDSITATRGASVELVEAPVSARRADGIIETETNVLIRLLPSSDPGNRTSTLAIRWPNGRTREQSLAWRVLPLISVAPSGLVLNPKDGRVTRSLLLTARESEFQILGVAGELLNAAPNCPTEPSRVHRITVDLDPARHPGPKATDLLIRTNLADQPIVPVSVVVLPQTEDAP
jgi:hypothetical protein